MKNWKTSLAGLVTALGLTLTQSDDSTLKLVGSVLTPLGALLTGFFAKDLNVTGGKVQQ